MTSAQEVAQSLGSRLAIWGGGSVAVGAVLAAVGRTPTARAFGVQTAGWGAIDLVIAGVGAVRSSPVEATKLRKTLLLNAGLDVGYIAGGAHMVYHRPTFGGRLTVSESIGHGAAVAVQGAALLVLDSYYARRLRAVPNAIDVIR